MTNKEAFKIASDCQILSYSKGLKLGVIRHLRTNFDLLADTRKRYQEIANLKLDATPEEIKEDQEAFMEEEFSGGFIVLPADAFNDVVNEEVVMSYADGSRRGFNPRDSFFNLMEMGIILDSARTDIGV